MNALEDTVTLDVLESLEETVYDLDLSSFFSDEENQIRQDKVNKFSGKAQYEGMQIVHNQKRRTKLNIR